MDQAALMSDSKNWSFPPNLQPDPEDLSGDLDKVLNAVVALRAEIPEDAFTAAFLGTDRSGSGVVIREDGLILTIGYLITEAQSIWLTANDGTVMQGHTLAYDQASGFGLIQPLGRLKLPMLKFASTASIEAEDDVFAIAYGGRAEVVDAVQKLAKEVQTGKVQPEEINEQSITNHLYMQDEPDLIIRTG